MTDDNVFSQNASYMTNPNGPAQSMDNGDVSAAPRRPNILTQAFRRICELHQHYLDRSTPHVIPRWVVWVALLATYGLRVYLLQGWYIVTYALGIFLLNLLLAFLTPKIDPALDDNDDDGPSLPTRTTDEFRPFMRRLPEFKFWYSAAKAVVIAMTCTFFDALNIPVFWPILVMYFIILFTITMKRQIKHMIRYRYLPFSFGKTKYKGKEDTGPVMHSEKGMVSSGVPVTPVKPNSSPVINT